MQVMAHADNRKDRRCHALLAAALLAQPKREQALLATKRRSGVASAIAIGRQRDVGILQFRVDTEQVGKQQVADM
jgi:hypothetical protein